MQFIYRVLVLVRRRGKVVHDAVDELKELFRRLGQLEELLIGHPIAAFVSGRFLLKEGVVILPGKRRQFGHILAVLRHDDFLTRLRKL
ncbi:hypothetical protein HMSSN036_11680 [Paenibacillus macerans]|nr:hypothetical protein HMSSN036_11680 [Paenibacillus macerans]